MTYSDSVASIQCNRFSKYFSSKNVIKKELEKANSCGLSKIYIYDQYFKHWTATFSARFTWPKSHSSKVSGLLGLKKSTRRDKMIKRPFNYLILPYSDNCRTICSELHLHLPVQ